MAKRPLSELKDALKQKENQLKKSLVDVAHVMALNFKAYADRQIKTKGIPGESYSTNPLPANWLEANAKTQYGREAIKKKAKKGPVSYKDLREAENLQTDHVDFTFSGETLRGFGIIETKQVGDSNWLSYLGGITPASKKKLSYALDMYGPDMWFKVVGKEGQELLKNILEKEMERIKKEIEL